MERYLETFVPSFDGHKLWARSIGWGEPALVLCDGLGCDGYVWKYLIPHFENRHRIIHWNYRGHGKTAPPENLQTLAIEDFARDLERVIDYFQLEEPPVLLGHSMGVQVILEFAHRFPARARALVAITGSYGRALDHVHDAQWPKAMYPLLKELFESTMPLSAALWKKFFTSELAYLYAITFEINGNLIKREDFFPYLEHLARMDPRIFMLTLEAAARHTAEPYLQDIELPTLIIAAEKDRFTPFWIGQRMQMLMPRARLVKLPLCSHTGPLEMPELTNLSVEKFLEELPRRSAKRRRPSSRE